MKIFKIMLLSIMVLLVFSVQTFALTKQAKVDTRSGSGEEVQNNSLVGIYGKDSIDTIPLYTNYRIPIQNKLSENEKIQTDDELGRFINSLNRSFPIFSYPNPAKESITIMLGDNLHNSELAISTIKKFGLDYVDYIRLFEIKGKIIWEKKGPIYLDEFPITIETNNLDNGTYFVEVRYAGKWRGIVKVDISK